ncbi:unnamed protein product [Alopecurus aequalis]
MAAESWWCWRLSAWLSSGTACFLFLNAIICLVAVSSWGRGGGDAARSTRRKRLTRSASSMLMERLRSVSSTIFSFQYPAADDYDSIVSPPEEGEMRPEASEEEPELAVSLVQSMAVTMAPLRTPSAPVAVAADTCAAASTSGSEKEDADTREEISTPAAAAGKGDATLRNWKVAGTVERRAYAEMAEKVEVNARAERFIRQFREDLKLERLNSILGCGRSAPAR